MGFYTFIMNYNGGIYSEQVSAESLWEARKIWLRKLDVTEINNFSEKNREKLIKEDFKDDDPSILVGLHNIWCFMLIIRRNKEAALINVIKTDIQFEDVYLK
jgi:hypothetical protein